jgi:hypothetical protein
MKPFIIYTYPFSFGIGGVVVLHKLCDLLNSLGQKAYIFPEPFPGQTEPFFLLNESYNTPIITQEILSDINNCIVIYPEVIRGNPLNAKNVVRWLLNRSDIYEDSYGPNDLIFYHSKSFYSQKLKNENNMLTIMEFHDEIFKDYNLQRKGSCYAIRKCENPKFIHPHNSIEIKWNDAGNYELLVHLFNTTETFYCYDDTTFLSVQAAMCGCTSIIVPSKYTKNEWTEKSPEMWTYGVAYGNIDSEIAYANSTRKILLDKIQEYKNNTTEINNFISICQK